jgi:polysaccharide biosynthesis protein PelD
MPRKRSLKLRKYGEIFSVFLAFFLIDQLFEFDLTSWRSSVLFCIALFFSLKYGWKLGMIGFSLTVIYQMLFSLLNNMDILLLIYDTNQANWLFMTLIGSVLSGLFITSIQEQYKQLNEEHSEIKGNYHHLSKMNEVLEQSRNQLIKKIMEFENTPSTLSLLMRSIYDSKPDQIYEHLVQTLTTYFQTNEVFVYLREPGSNSFRMYEQVNQSTPLAKQCISIETSTFYKRLIEQKKVMMRDKTDEENAPLLAGVISIKDEVTSIIVMNQIAFERLTPYEMDVLQNLLYWTGDCLEHSGEALHIFYKKASVSTI